MEKRITFYRKPHLEKPDFIAAWPVMGNVALKATSFLRDKLKAEEFAEIEAVDSFPLSGIIIRENLVEKPRLPRSKFYPWKGSTPSKDLLIFIGDAQPSSDKEYAFVDGMMDVAMKVGVERSYTFAAMPSNIDHKQVPKVWGVATHRNLIEIFREFGVHIMSDGHISGLNGSLLGMAKMREIEEICFLGEIPSYATQIENPRSSKAVLEVLGSMLKINMDMTELETLAQYTETEIGRNIRQIREDSQFEKMPRGGGERSGICSLNLCPLPLEGERYGIG
jgi:proteasome assembly chaperone (PAC2) family protein